MAMVIPIAKPGKDPMNPNKIIQYNINGFYNNFTDLNLLGRDYDPLIFALQETHLTSRKTPCLKGYHVFWRNHPSNTAKGGTAILIKEQNWAREIPIHSTLECTVIQTKMRGRYITICSLYLNPGERIDYAKLSSLVEELPTPFLILGDYNAQSVAWGSSTTNTRGRTIERFIEEHNLLLLNDGSFTYLSPSYGTFSAIDLSLCSPSLELTFNWNVAKDTYNSDHFPVILTDLDTNCSITRRKRWKEDSANWPAFQRQIAGKFTQYASASIDEQLDEFNNGVIGIAQKTIPVTSTNPKKKYVPWWTKEIKDAIKKRRRLYRIYKNYPTPENLSAFRISRSHVKKLVVEAKQKSWQDFVERIDSTSTSKEVWDKMRKLCGRFKGSGPTAMISSEGFVADQKLIAETLANKLIDNKIITPEAKTRHD
uniref:Endonuclease/exonuclease/phosphatase domain-containing protein n=1 Tax=Phlebotomus papatasi TaxID=29031 RepID=A0A1B0DIK5_PHLPP